MSQTTQTTPNAATTATTGRRPAGTPTWIDLGTDDIAGAEAFYGALFGWTFTDQGEEFGHYRMIHAGEHLVGGAMSTAGMTCPEGGEVPTQWGVYLATDDIEATVAKALEAGAKPAVPPMPVGEQGTMAVVVDPAGAAVGLWQARDLVGMDLPLAPGTGVWFEAMVRGVDADVPFYRDVLGWDVHESGTADWRYVTHGPQDQALAGLGEATGVYAPDAPAGWRIYLATADLDGDLRRIPELGGAVTDGPTDSPYGRLATVADPQGGTFQLIQLPTGDPARA